MNISLINGVIINIINKKPICMITLNEYIKESLLGDFDDLETSIDPRKDIEQFINDHYKIKGKLRISKKPNSNGKYEVSCLSASILDENITSLTNNAFVWLNIRKDFICSYCHSLKSLEGAPKEVGGDFYCQQCFLLASLEGAPEEVGEDFSCSYCHSLTSLEGAPKEVGGDFYCQHCKSLKTLEGAPKEIKKDFNCSSCESLTSLEGAPKCVFKRFYCQHCDSLTSLKGAPEVVGWGFNCICCKSLTSLEGAPKETQSIFCYDCGKMFGEDEIKKYIKNIKSTSIFNI